MAIGDSTTEGLNDPDGAGGYRGWADRLAEFLAAQPDGIEYANLAIRGRVTAQIRAEQVPAALALAPDLVTVVAGMNDILAPGFRAAAVAADIEAMFATFAGAGVTVLTLTMPDISGNLPLSRVTAPRLAALNRHLRAAAGRTGAILVDLERWPHAADPRLWSDDRLHGNSAGHDVVARAMAHGLGLPGFDESWRDPFPDDPVAPRTLLAEMRDDLRWTQTHALPWLWRTIRGRSVGDGLGPKRPEPRLLSREGR